MSDLERHWIAGLIKHSRAMTAFCCPTANCYRSIHRFQTPHENDWGVNDRLATYRAMKSDRLATYVENCLPTGVANPYLVLACTVAAGIDGISNRLDIPPARKEGAKELLEYRRKHIPKKEGAAEESYVPWTMEEAIGCLEHDDALKKALGAEFVRWFLQSKREHELEISNRWHDENDNSVRTATEQGLYLDLL